MNPVRKRRLIITLLILGAVAVATVLSVFALQRNMTYLYSPTEVDAGQSPDGHAFRLGGIVKEGSIHRVPDTLITDFVITDRFQSIPVQYTGILPDLFRVGQSTITTGKMVNGKFIATEVLAKHDATYMPPQVAQAIAKAKQDHRIPSNISPPPPAGEGQGGGESANTPHPPSGHHGVSGQGRQPYPQAGEGNSTAAGVQP